MGACHGTKFGVFFSTNMPNAVSETQATFEITSVATAFTVLSRNCQNKKRRQV
jgi:hypothetical protein